MKARLVPVYFADGRDEDFDKQLTILKELLVEEAEFLDEVALGRRLPDADAVIFPQFLGQAYHMVDEFKAMVKELHRNGIEVILDVVFNHTCEGNENGPTVSFKGLENQVYYILEEGGQHYANYSGCGNTLNLAHPMVARMVLGLQQMGMSKERIEQMRELLKANQQSIQDQLSQFAGQRIAENMSEEGRRESADDLLDFAFVQVDAGTESHSSSARLECSNGPAP